MLKLRIFSITATLGLATLGQPSSAQILVEEKGHAVPTSTYEINSSGHGFRQSRKVGVGFGLAGAYGIAGTHLELNFVPEVGLLVGFGLGSGYQTFNLQLKKVLAGDSFMPYIAGGLARWYSVDESRKRTSTQPHFLADRFLNRSERQSGEFAEVMLYPAVGLQYLQLGGDWSGFSLYAEIQMLVDVDDLVSALNGGVGTTFYF